MDRRGFLGSLLGTVAALTLPKIVLPEAEFLALPESKEWQRVNPDIPWRAMYFEEHNQKWVQGPAISRMDIAETKGGLLHTFDVETIVATSILPMDVSAIRLINEKIGSVDLRMRDRWRGLVMCPGETLTFR